MSLSTLDSTKRQLETKFIKLDKLNKEKNNIGTKGKKILKDKLMISSIMEKMRMLRIQISQMSISISKMEDGYKATKSGWILK